MYAEKMSTLRVDFAAQPQNTATCLVHWEPGKAHADTPQLGVDDKNLRVLMEEADKVGIDVPLGWPKAFVNSIMAHQRKEMWPAETMRDLRLRKTDQFIEEKTGKRPLSVSTDRIGITAFRATALISAIANADYMDRTGHGKLVEVYPAAALLRWELKPLVKRDTPKLAAALIERTSSWLCLTDDARDRCKTSRDALDSLIAALAARAAALGFCEPIPEKLASAAAIEGWIALPKPGSLEKLV